MMLTRQAYPGEKTEQSIEEGKTVNQADLGRRTFQAEKATEKAASCGSAPGVSRATLGGCEQRM